MSWRGPEELGEFPTLGYDVGAWIEAHVVIPDGYRQGEPYLLTDEMWRFLLHFYRVRLDAGDEDAGNGLHYIGAQFRRSQKFGKDPLGAAIILAEAMGPTRFDGWNAAGEPVGKTYPSPYIACLGTSEENTQNTYAPLLAMIRLGPLADWGSIDAGETRVKLPNGGVIEPVTASARARLGQRMTFITCTESHLWTTQAGYRRLAGAVKRNVAGMDGRWLELTNAWDPTEGSEAQVTWETADPRVLLDTVTPVRVEDLQDEEELMRELRRQYGDSAQERGGWVSLERIAHEVRSAAHLEADRRRFFLNEIVVGESVFVDPIQWDLQKRDETLVGGDVVALGFDGAKYRDATALVASRISDGMLFNLGVWERPVDADRDWRVPSPEVDRAVRSAIGAYQVVMMFYDPYRWQDYGDAWCADFGGERVVEFPTNQEQRMDRALERFTTAFAQGDITHDGSEALTRHFKAAVLVKGGRKRPRPGEELSLSTHYLKMSKRADGLFIDAAVAGTLAHEARAYAIERGMLPKQRNAPRFAWG